MDPAFDMLAAGYARRHNAGAAQRSADLGDARNKALGVGPDADAVTMATVLRDARPDRPRLTVALTKLAADTYKAMRGTLSTAPAPSRPRDRQAPGPNLVLPITPPAQLTRADLRAGNLCQSHLLRNCVRCRV